MKNSIKSTYKPGLSNKLLGKVHNQSIKSKVNAESAEQQPQEIVRKNIKDLKLSEEERNNYYNKRDEAHKKYKEIKKEYKSAKKEHKRLAKLV